MPKIKKAILDIAEASGYEGGEPATIIGALDALTDTLAGSDVDAADCISDAITTLSPSMGPVPSGTISITSNGTGIDVTEYAAVDVAVSGGASFGELHVVPMEDSAAPTVGGSAESPRPVGITKIGTSADAAIVDADGTNINIIYVASGVYLTVMPDVSYATSAAGYVVTVDMQEGKYATVAQWDGTFTLDTTSVADYNCFGFTMPELEQGEYLILVFSGSTVNAD